MCRPGGIRLKRERNEICINPKGISLLLTLLALCIAGYNIYRPDATKTNQTPLIFRLAIQNWSYLSASYAKVLFEGHNSTGSIAIKIIIMQLNVFSDSRYGLKV
jgi:hypothetical protein